MRRIQHLRDGRGHALPTAATADPIAASPPRAVAPPRVSLIFPAHNEEAVIGRTLHEYLQFLDARVGTGAYEVLVVLNGCSDRTWEVVEGVRADRPAVGWLLLPQAGKGAALRAGFLQAQGDWVGFVDADGQIPPEEFHRLLLVLERFPDVDGAIGSKYCETARASAASPLRSLTGHGFNAIVRLAFGLPFRDTQCGAKLFRRSALRGVLPQLRLNGWTFDVELLAHLHRRGCRIAEVPLTLRSGGRPSRLRPLRAVPQMLTEILSLRCQLPPRGEACSTPQRSRPRPLLGEILCALELLHPDQVQQALRHQRRERRRLGEILVQMGWIAARELQWALSLQRV